MKEKDTTILSLQQQLATIKKKILFGEVSDTSEKGLEGKAAEDFQNSLRPSTWEVELSEAKNAAAVALAARRAMEDKVVGLTVERDQSKAEVESVKNQAKSKIDQCS